MTPPVSLVEHVLATSCAGGMLERVLAAGGGFEHIDGGSAMLLNRAHGGCIDGWFWDATSWGVRFGRRPFEALWTMPGTAMADTLVATGGDLARAADRLAHGDNVQLSLLGGE